MPLTEQENNLPDVLNEKTQPQSGGNRLSSPLENHRSGVLLGATASIRTRGPIPSPDQFNDYPPEVQSKIVEWANNQHYHRIEMERLVTIEDQKRLNRGQFMTAVIATSGIIAAALVAGTGGWLAVAAITIPAIGGPTAAAALGHALASRFNKPPKEEQGPPKSPPKKPSTRKNR